MIGTRPPTTV
jgi:hypothetical protein